MRYVHGLLALVVLASILVGSPSHAQTCAPSPPGMVSWWPGEDDARDIQDSNDGTLANGTTFGAGKVGRAFLFDGADDAIDVAHNANLNCSSGITIEAWVNLSSGGHGRPIAQKRSSSNVGGYTFETTGTPFGPDGLQWVIWIGGVQHLVSASGILSFGTWQHMAATYDGAAMRIYVDGAEVATGAVAGSIDAVGDPFVIGRNVVITGFDWHGLIDELHVFDRALSATEIQAIVAAGAAGICGPTAVGSFGPVVASTRPNPFRRETALSYHLAVAADVHLALYDARGKLVRTLVRARHAAGPHSVAWDGKDEHGVDAPTGVYFYRLLAGETMVTRKIVMLD